MWADVRDAGKGVDSLQFGELAIVVGRLVFLQIAGRDHPGFLAVRPEGEEEPSVSNGLPEEIIAHLTVRSLGVREEPDREGIFEDFLKLMRLDKLRIEGRV